MCNCAVNWCDKLCFFAFICQDGDLELDSLRDARPMEAGQRVGDVVGSLRVIDQPRSALTGVVGPSRPGGQPGRYCHSPKELANTRLTAVSGTYSTLQTTDRRTQRCSISATVSTVDY